MMSGCRFIGLFRMGIWTLLFCLLRGGILILMFRFVSLSILFGVDIGEMLDQFMLMDIPVSIWVCI